MSDVLTKKQAEHCINLLSMLDLFFLGQQQVVNRKHRYNKQISEEEFILECRLGWFKNPSVIHSFLKQNPQLVSQDHKLVETWKHGIDGRFVVVKNYCNYTALYSLANHSFYGVKGLEDSIIAMFPEDEFAVLEIRLLPFNDTIIIDGLASCNQRMRSEFGAYLLRQADAAVRGRRIITNLLDTTNKQKIAYAHIVYTVNMLSFLQEEMSQ